jgi:hypothetical protein
MVISATTQSKKKTKYVGFENEKKDTQQCRQLQENSFDVFNSFNFYVLLFDALHPQQDGCHCYT